MAERPKAVGKFYSVFSTLTYAHSSNHESDFAECCYATVEGSIAAVEGSEEVNLNPKYGLSETMYYIIKSLNFSIILFRIDSLLYFFET